MANSLIIVGFGAREIRSCQSKLGPRAAGLISAQTASLQCAPYLVIRPGSPRSWNLPFVQAIAGRRL